MLTDNFKATAAAINDAVPNLDVYTLLNLTQKVVDINTVALPVKFSHDALVEAALGSGRVLEALQRDQKILAIKELRFLTNAGLKDTKDAIEDYRVNIYRIPGGKDIPVPDGDYCCVDCNGPLAYPPLDELYPLAREPLSSWERDLFVKND